MGRKRRERERRRGYACWHLIKLVKCQLNYEYRKRGHRALTCFNLMAKQQRGQAGGVEEGGCGEGKAKRDMVSPSRCRCKLLTLLSQVGSNSLFGIKVVGGKSKTGLRVERHQLMATMLKWPGNILDQEHYTNLSPMFWDPFLQNIAPMFLA